MNSEYIPFGKEWEDELSKTTKKFLIAYLRDTLIKQQNIISLIDGMIDKDDNSYGGECVFNVLTSLKQQIEKL